MRCLSLAEKLIARGHEVVLLTNDSKVDWLEAAIQATGVQVKRVESDSLNLSDLDDLDPDWLIVDSYQIAADLISDANRKVPVLAIVDSDSRGIDATAYLDTNLFAEEIAWPKNVKARLLAGSSYSLVRDAVMKAKREHPWQLLKSTPKFLVFLGGSDPYDYSPLVAKALGQVEGVFTATFIAPDRLHDSIRISLGSKIEQVELISPTPRLADFYQDADVVVSAAGTSSWDICTLGIPALLLAVVDNQEFSMQQIAEHGLALTNNLTKNEDDKVSRLTAQLQTLLSDSSVRQKLSETSLRFFDGLGRDRVVDYLEKSL